MKEWYNDKLQLDRVDNNKWYSKDNCRWVTAKQNCNNTRKNKIITYNWETHTLSERARELWMNVHTYIMM